MTTPSILKKEIWLEASEESTRILEHIESLYLLVQRFTHPDSQLSKLIEGLVPEHEKFNRHLLSIQEKDEKGHTITPSEWSQAESMTIVIVGKLLMLQDDIGRETAAGKVLEGAGQHFDKFTKLFEQLRSAATTLSAVP